MTTSNTEKADAAAHGPDSWRAFSERLFDQNKFAIKLGLHSMRVAFKREGDPQSSAPAIIVGGTNGKGGTSAALLAILRAHGLKTGFYSSPHLIEVRERFRIDGAPAPRDVVLRHGKAVLEKWGNPKKSFPCLTFFELTTLMAARIFDEVGVDVTIWEVGLGGRLDAVNSIEPAMTIVTSIGYDHQQYLGDTIEEIAGEKAALFRSGVPSFIGHQEHPTALEVLRESAPHADVVDAPDVGVRERNHRLAKRAARSYLESIGVEFDESVADAAIGKLVWWGRQDDRVVDGQRYLIDAAHNAQGARSMRQWLDALDAPAPGAVLFAVMADKAIDALLEDIPEVPIVHAKLVTERAARREEIEAVLGRSVAASLPTNEAVARARDLAGGRPILAYGSLYLLGELYEALGFTSDDLVV